MQTTLKKSLPYTIVPNWLLRSDGLSIEARGLLSLMLSYDDGWKFNAKYLMKVCGCGKEKYYRMIKEIKDIGALEVSPIRGEGGRISGHEYDLSGVFQNGGNPECVSTRITETRTHKNNNSKNNNYKNPLYPPEGESLLEETSDESLSNMAKRLMNVFPKKKNNSSLKEVAKRLKAALKSHKYEEILAAAKEYALSREGEDSTYTKALAPWLNADRHIEYIDYAKQRVADEAASQAKAIQKRADAEATRQRLSPDIQQSSEANDKFLREKFGDGYRG